MTEMQEIREALAEIRADMREWRAAQQEMCRNACAQRQGHHVTLYGAEGATGLVSRVQTIEEIARLAAPLPSRVQTLEERVGLVWIGVLGFLGMLCKLVWDYVAAPRQ